MTVLVTGATGFLGATLLRALRGLGRPAIGLGRDPARIAALRAEGHDLRAHDLTHPLPAADLPAIQAVVHAAALSAPFGPAAAFHAANVTATAHIAALARAKGARLVHISSASVLFAPRDQLHLPEDTSLPRPYNAYAATKARAEDIARALPGSIILRPRGIYGAGDTALLPRLLRAAARGPLPLLRNGAGRIDLTHVDDVVSAILAALDAPPSACNRLYHISGGQVLPITEIASRACQAAGQDLRWRAMPLPPLMAAAALAEGIAKLRKGHPEPVVTRYGLALFAYAQSLDITRARDHLGWVPQVDFTTGLARSIPAQAAP
jgi:nucleoside-diphosphate-sugar epimerase